MAAGGGIVIQTTGEVESSPRKQAGIVDADRERVELDGRRDFFRLRRNWSRGILFWITLLIFFNMGITAGVGLGFLSFVGYEWFITAITVETFLQIVGLGYVAARYLFK